MTTNPFPLSLRGVVRHGDKRGRLLGFPTANLNGDTPQKMAFGVYASETTIIGRGPQVYRSVTSYGTRPTFDGAGSRIETHILDFSSDIYGCEIEVRLLAFIRAEQRFDGIDDLVAALHGDIATARALSHAAAC